MDSTIAKDLARILNELQTPYWTESNFWIATILSTAGLYFSVQAFREARAAKRAANEAGRTVKIQTVAIELSEVSQKLDGIGVNISFSEARNLLAEITRKLRRVTSPFADDPKLSAAIASLREAMDAAQDSLKAVRPVSGNSEEQAESAVYYGIENDFANINNLIADLIGLLEKGVIGLGESDVEH